MPTASPPVVDSILDLIGHTPLVRLKSFEHVGPEGARGAKIWAKAEHLNPGGSVKDRICLAMIQAALAKGELSPGQEVVEPTSGNTGIGLALVCRRLGHPLTLTMPASMSLERRAALKDYGAKIELTEPERVMDGAIAAAERLVRERGAYLPQQFENPANPQSHRETTAPEILAALEGQAIAAFVSSVGTGGTISGVSGVLRAAHPAIQIIGVEPESSPVLSGGAPGPSKIQGLNAGFVPKNYDPQAVDAMVLVSDRSAWDTKVALARQEGLLVGISSGANVFVAAKIAATLPEDAHVVTLLCDTGERYFSLEEHFAQSSGELLLEDDLDTAQAKGEGA